MPESVPDVVSKSFSALIPGVVILILFAGTLKLIEVSGLGSLNNIFISYYWYSIRGILQVLCLEHLSQCY